MASVCVHVCIVADMDSQDVWQGDKLEIQFWGGSELSTSQSCCSTDCWHLLPADICRICVFCTAWCTQGIWHLILSEDPHVTGGPLYSLRREAGFHHWRDSSITSTSNDCCWGHQLVTLHQSCSFLLAASPIYNSPTSVHPKPYIFSKGTSKPLFQSALNSPQQPIQYYWFIYM